MTVAMVRSRGFTLIELAVCLAIVAVMTVALLPGAMEKYQQGKINSSILQAKNLIPVCEIARTKAVSSTVGANLKVTHTYGSLTNWSKTADLQNLLSADYRLPATNPLGSNILVKFDSQRCYIAVDLPFKEDNYGGYITENVGANTRIIITTRPAQSSSSAWVSYQKRILHGETTR